MNRLNSSFLIVSIVTTAAVAGGGLPAAAGPAGAAGQGDRSIAWAPCPENAEVECGTLRVPIDWARPDAATIDLALARRPATDPAARIGALVLNPGGPGGSGVDPVIATPALFSDEINRHFDIVGFDPRGVGRSHPVVCATDLLNDAPSPLLTSQDDFDARIAYNRRLGQDCRAHTGALFDHVDTLSGVRDLDAIRAALGERRLTYYGLSYGTLLGQEYAELFPDRVRALALDSNMDHSLGTAQFMDSQTATAQDSFDEFVAWCDRTAGCALHGRDVRAIWAGLLARAGRGELPDPWRPGTMITPLTLVSYLISGFYGPYWYQAADLLAQMEATPAPQAATAPAAPATLPAPATQLAPATQQAAIVPRTAEPGGSTTQDDEALSAYPFSIFCEDWALPIRDYPEYADHLARSAELAPDLGYSYLALFGPAACLGWPAPVRNPQHRLQVRHTSPLLLLNAVHDPSTSYAWATGTARQLGASAVLLTYEGWGHGVYGRESCASGAMDRYLVSLALPPAGSRCPAVEPAPEQLAGVVAAAAAPPLWG